MHCNLSIQRPPNPKIAVAHRKLRAINSVNLRHDIAVSPLCLYDQPPYDVTTLCDQFYTILSSILEKHAPLITKTIVQRSHAPWYTDDIRVQKTRRRQLERRLRHSQLPADRCAFNAKMSFYSTLIHDAGTDSHALFKTIDRLLHRKSDKRLPYYSSSVELANK